MKPTLLDLSRPVRLLCSGVPQDVDVKVFDTGLPADRPLLAAWMNPSYSVTPFSFYFGRCGERPGAYRLENIPEKKKTVYADVFINKKGHVYTTATDGLGQRDPFLGTIELTLLEGKVVDVEYTKRPNPEDAE